MASDVPGTFEYEIFIVHAEADASFVRGYLLDAIGLDRDRVLLSSTLPLGQSKLAAIEHGVRTSRITVPILTPAYMVDRWAELGEQLAGHAGEARLVPLLLKDLELPLRLDFLVALDFRDPIRWVDEIRRLRDCFDQPAPVASDVPCPYPGMRAYAPDAAACFYGREAEVDEILSRLRAGEREIYIMGPSGSGKSSLMAAGVLPRLVRGGSGLGPFLIRMLRPSEAPAARLAEALELDVAAPEVTVDALLARGPAGGCLLLVVDQLEELFTLASTDERARFLAALRSLRAQPRCVLVLVLRADFYGAFMESPLWSDLQGRLSRIEVAPLRGPALRAAIEQPARERGVFFEPELVERLLSDAAMEPGILPLLQETLIQLWDRRRLRLLTLADYQALGDNGRSGLAVAIARRADATLRALTLTQEAIARRILLRLVSFGEGRSDTRRQQPLAALRAVGDEAGDFDAVVQRMVGDRLLTIDGDHDDARVDLAHEVMITAWPTLAGWIQTRRADEQRRRQLEVAAALWNERGRGDGGLLDPIELAEVEAWYKTESARDLGESPGVSALVAASRTAREKQRQERRAALWRAAGVVSVLAVLGVALTVMIWLRAEAAEQRSLADARARKIEQQLVQGLLERGQQALLGGTVEPALTALGEAYRRGDRSPALRFMLARARESKEAELATLDARADPVWFATFSPDGDRVLTTGQDAVVHVWDAATGRELFALREHAPPVAAAWSPGGEVATSDAAGVIRLWTAGGQLRTKIRGAPGTPTRIAFSRDGARFAVARAGGNVAIIDARAGALRATWQAEPISAETIAFDPSGGSVVTAGPSPTAVVWSLDGRELARLEGHSGAIWHAIFDATGERVLTASLDKTARVWDVRSGKTLHRLVGHDDRVTSIAIDEHTQRIATASADTTVRIWSLDTGEPLATLRGHTAQVNAVAFASGDQLVSASSDGTARVWDLIHGVETATYHHGGYLRAGLDPAGRRVVTASWSGTAKIWDLRRQARLQTYASPVAGSWGGISSIYAAMVETGRLAHIGPRGIAVWDLASKARWTWSAPDIVGGALTPDGRVGVAADARGTIHVLDGSGNLQRRFPGPSQGVACIAVFSDGRHAVTGSPGGRFVVWELATGQPVAERQIGAANEIFLSRDGGALVAFEDANRRLQGKATAWLVSSDLARVIRLEHGAGVLNAQFSPDGARLVTLSFDGTASVWRRDGGLEATLDHPGPVVMVAWSSDGSWLATGTRAGTLTIWDRATWRARKAIDAHGSFINALEIDDHDSLIASAGGDGVVKLWDASTLLQVARIPTGMLAAHLAFERGQILVTGSLATQSWRCEH
jgi:WD40 repeat protein